MSGSIEAEATQGVKALSVSGSAGETFNDRFDDSSKVLELGAGAFGEVRVCKEKTEDDDGMLYAVKEIKFNGNKYQVMKELEAWSQVQDHHGVVNKVAHYVEKGSLKIVMEMCSHGDLADRIARLGSCSVPETQSIMYQLSNVLIFLKERGIVHRDIKPDNCLLNILPDGSIVVKLADFGLAALVSVSKGREKSFTKGIGTNGFAPPEMGNDKDDERALKYSAKDAHFVDVFGAGRVGQVALTGYHRPSPETWAVHCDVETRIETGFPQAMCLTKMTSYNAQDRPPIEEVVNYVFIQGGRHGSAAASNDADESTYVVLRKLALTTSRQKLNREDLVRSGEFLRYPAAKGALLALCHAIVLVWNKEFQKQPALESFLSDVDNKIINDGRELLRKKKQSTKLSEAFHALHGNKKCDTKECKGCKECSKKFDPKEWDDNAAQAVETIHKLIGRHLPDTTHPKLARTIILAIANEALEGSCFGTVRDEAAPLLAFYLWALYLVNWEKREKEAEKIKEADESK